MKNIKWLPLLLMLGVFLVSCEKEQKKEWNKYYGYSNEEIVGSYSFSKVEDAFEDVDFLSELFELVSGSLHDANAEAIIKQAAITAIIFFINLPPEF